MTDYIHATRWSHILKARVGNITNITVGDWYHPDTRVVIQDVDMPWELKPESHHD